MKVVLELFPRHKIGFKEKDFYVNTLAANLRAIEKELKKARKIAPKGNFRL